ncbi:J domain-containing protein [Achromobacter sp. JD417]|uniref:J domain-containing protein n=1 Tax=Achromobacter TaxID=222 RepID=UPI0028A94321|nr:J domain-containing protein [Achromobacter mucicolens]
MYFHYVVLKKNEDFLAVLTNSNTQWELGHYHDQGYAFFMEVSAFSASAAIEVARQNENSEIIKLQSELNALRHEYKKLLSENSNLKFNGRFGYSFGANNLNPLEVLGFTTQPNQEEIKKRYRQLAQKLHPDKGGNNFLMQLIQNAYEQLNIDKA